MPLHRPLWTPDLDLMPQHLQTQDRYHEELLASRLAMSHPFAWGVSELQIDARRLAAFEFVVERFVGILPDGTLLEVGGHGESFIAPRHLGGVLSQAPAIEVAVALPKAIATGANVGAHQARYREAVVRVADFNTGEDPIDVLVAQPQPLLLFAGERVDGYDVLPIARVMRDPTGAPVLDPEFSPPALHLRASEFLIGCVRRVVQVSHAQIDRLRKGRKRGKDVDGPAALQLVMLSTIQQLVAPLVDGLEQPTTPPHDVFLTLAELAGALTTFDPSSEGSEPAVLPHFEHARPGDSIGPLAARVTTILTKLMTSRSQKIPLQRADGNRHYAELKEEGIFRNNFFLAVMGSSESAVREQLGRVAKVATWEDIPMLITSNTSGARLQHEHLPPAALPLRPGVVYFRIDTSAREWQSVVARGNVCIFQPFEPATTTIELLAVDPTATD